MKEDEEAVYVIVSLGVVVLSLRDFEFLYVNQIEIGPNPICISDSFVPPLLNIPTLVLLNTWSLLHAHSDEG